MHDELINEIKRKLDFIQGMESNALIDILTYNTLVNVDVILECWHETVEASKNWLCGAIHGALYSDN